jgi:8-oxo-dGTP diphosphatase
VPSRTPISREDREFLRDYDPRDFERLSVAVDVALVTAQAGMLRVLLVRRQDPPQRGRWALPGGFVGPRESLDAAAERVLAAKAGLEDLYLEQLYTFGAVDRDPRTRVISVSYYALVETARLARVTEEQRTLARISVPWKGERGGKAGALDEDGAALPLAFDHAEILGLVVKRLRGKLRYAPIGFELLPDLFPLRALQEIHETVLGASLNKDSFRRSVLASGLVRSAGKREPTVGHRPAELYRFSALSKGKDR